MVPGLRGKLLSRFQFSSPRWHQVLDSDDITSSLLSLSLRGFPLPIISGFLHCPRQLSISIIHISNKSPAFNSLCSICSEWFLPS